MQTTDVNELAIQTRASEALPPIPFELEALSRAERYQEWVFSKIRRFIGKRILELGAGVGNMSRWIPARELLVLTETDPYLLSHLTSSTQGRMDSSRDKVRVEKFDVLTQDPSRYVHDRLDTIVSFNVLEHIEDDAEALRRLCAILTRDRPLGETRRLVTFVPAHPWAYAPMDREFGHFRRYSASRIRKIVREIAPEARLHLEHFNLPGLIGWWVSGRLLGRNRIGLGSIALFEKLCPVIRVVDWVVHSVFRLPLGQSIVFVLEWK